MFASPEPIETVPWRECAQCGKVAVRCVNITAHLVNGVPAGTTYEMYCGTCMRAFTLETPGRTVALTLYALCLLFMGQFFVAGMVNWLRDMLEGDMSAPSWDAVFLALLMGAAFFGGAGIIIRSIVRWRSDHRNPIAEPPA